MTQHHSFDLLRRFVVVLLGCTFAFNAAHAAAQSTRRVARPNGKVLVAHRGASAYAPEHTLQAYELAIKQGADYVEQDLQITKDGVLVCLHDSTLERTTNIEDVFPDRFITEHSDGRKIKRWRVGDFTLSEIKQLDAGIWFAPKFKGARVPTFAEAIKLIRGRAGLYPETKAPDESAARGFDMERLVLAELRKYGLDRRVAEQATPIIIQSFSAESLRKMRIELRTDLPLVLLIGDGNEVEWAGALGLRRAAEFASGIGVAKSLVSKSLVETAHAAGLSVTPYTLRSRDTGRFSSVRDEINYFLYTLGVDGVFTDNPDEFPRSPLNANNRF